MAKKKTSMPEPYSPPPYVPSKYDAGSSETLFNFYDPRVKGENLGFADEDLKTMQGQAQDYSTRNMNEAIRRGGASRRAGTGGTWTGGRDVMRDESIRSGLEYRSNAMRDIAVRNAVMKHQDQWNAASGMGNFLNNERAQANNLWTGNRQNAQQAYEYNQLLPFEVKREENLYNQANRNQMFTDMAKIGMMFL